MKTKLAPLSEKYTAALRKHLMQGARTSLKSAHVLGCQALAKGLQTVDVAMMHRHAMITLVVPGESAAAIDEMITRAETFLVEALKPIDRENREAIDANVQLNQANQTLHGRTVELAEANRKLKREVVRRRATEEKLRKSELHQGKLLKDAHLMQEQLRHLTRQVLVAQEEERKEISRELHDDIAQALAAINVHLETLTREATKSTKGLKKRIAASQKVVEKSVNIVNRFARNLRPTLLDDLGLIPALRSYAKEFEQRTKIGVDFTAFSGVERLSIAKRTALYRVAQAALINVAQHAKATKVKLSIQKVREKIRMEIRDDGKSFDVERVLFSKRHNRLGLLGMRERVEMVGGSFSVVSAPGAGTTICATLPLPLAIEKGKKPAAVKKLAT